MINPHTGKREILVLDFDGVIHSYTSGWQGADCAPDPPVLGTYDFIVLAVHEFKICVISARSSQEGGIECMYNYLRDRVKLPPEVLEDIEFPVEKPPAHLTIDDRAWGFTGTWPTIVELKNFKPWNKQEV